MASPPGQARRRAPDALKLITLMTFAVSTLLLGGLTAFTSVKLVRMAQVRGWVGGSTLKTASITQKIELPPSNASTPGPKAYWVGWTTADIRYPGRHRINLPREQWEQVSSGDPVTLVYVGDVGPYLRDGIFASNGNLLFDVVLLAFELASLACCLGGVFALCRKRGRWNHALVATTAVVMVGGCASGMWLRSLVDTRELETALVEDVRRMTAAPGERLSHVDDPGPVPFGEAVEPFLDGLTSAHRIWEDAPEEDQKTANAVMAGERPLRDLPVSIRKMYESARTDAAGALLASRAANGRAPEGLRTFSDPRHPRQEIGLLRLQAAARVAALDIRFLLEKGDVESASTICIDGLALGRDASLELGLLGCNLGGAMHGILARPCAAALDRSDRESKRDAVRRIRRIRDAMPTLASSLHQQSVIDQLILFGHVASSPRLDALPPEAQTLVDLGREMSHEADGGPHKRVTKWDLSFVERLLHRNAWRQYVALRTSAESSADLPKVERDAAFAAMASSASRSWNPIVEPLLGDPGEHTRWHFAGLGVLERLRLGAAADAYQSERSEWTRNQSDLIGAGLLAAPVIDPTTGSEMKMQIVGDALEIRVRPDGAASQLDLSFTADQGN